MPRKRPPAPPPVRCEVCRLDGVPGRDGVAVGPVAGEFIGRRDLVANLDRPIPVSIEFDDKRVIGSARLTVEGDRLIADLYLAPDLGGTAEALRGKYPAIGFVAREFTTDAAGVRTITALDVLHVGIVDANADPRIPPFEVSIGFKVKGE